MAVLLTACTASGPEPTVIWPLLLVRGDVLAAAARKEALQAQAILRTIYELILLLLSLLIAS